MNLLVKWYGVEEKQRRSYIVNQEHIHLLWSSERIEKQITEYLWAKTKCEKSGVNHMFSKICYIPLIRDRNALCLSLKELEAASRIKEMIVWGLHWEIHGWRGKQTKKNIQIIQYYIWEDFLHENDLNLIKREISEETEVKLVVIKWEIPYFVEAKKKPQDWHIY